MSQKDSNGNGTKAFAGVLVIVAIIGGVAAIIRPLQQQIEYIKFEISRGAEYVLRHESVEGHANAIASLAKLQERFVEVETRFRNLDERTERIEKGVEIEMQRVRSKIEKIDNRIDALGEQYIPVLFATVKEVEVLKENLEELKFPSCDNKYFEN